MAEADRVDAIRQAFAELMGELEDAALIACDGQTARTIAEARAYRLQLVTALESMLARLRELGERLE